MHRIASCACIKNEFQNMLCKLRKIQNSFPIHNRRLNNEIQADFFCTFAAALACCGCFCLGVAGGALLTGGDVVGAEANNTALFSSSTPATPGCIVKQDNSRSVMYIVKDIPKTQKHREDQ